MKVFNIYLLAISCLLPARATSLEFDYFGVFDLYGVATDSSQTWLDQGLGKGRYSDDGLKLGQAIIGTDIQLTDTLSAHGLGSFYTDPDPRIDLTEFYLHYRPVPRSPIRHELRLGAFFPSFSKENIAPGWLSPFTWTPSAINSWIGEELRTLGLEATLTREGKFTGSPHDFSFTSALFAGNDPAGSLLVWRGWALHGRQSRLFEEVPLAPLPSFPAGGTFEFQSQSVQPVLEIDDRIGFYIAGSWDYMKRSSLEIAYYDNRGKPDELSDANGQYSWDTQFIHVAWHLRLAREFDLIVQYMDGDTAMGGIFPPFTTAVIADFDAFFILLSKSFRQHRFSLRYDDFAVDDRDNTTQDDNNDSGHAWTLAYFWSFNKNLRFGLEWLHIDSAHTGRRYLGLAAAQEDSQLQAGIRWRW